MGGLQSRPAKEADALTISVILLLQEVMTVSGRDTSYPAHIVGMVRTALHSQHRAWQQSRKEQRILAMIMCCHRQCTEVALKPNHHALQQLSCSQQLGCCAAMTHA